ncbi:DUF4097 domain-containing protein [Streptomyces yaizuensis]|uniref:DUF4097 domain-containing protein n=1 Tax=Streptomyces yaizuensis TaxID=2989713 RepID=A0ABQ5NU53_9ACTN|nr:DUF4097 domain-containing protein [Streptomyces sp. YSPA8]
MALLTGCGAADAGEAAVERKAFPFSGKVLTVDSDNSAVRVIAADVSRVEVTRQVDGWVFAGSGPEKSWKLADGRLTLRMKCTGVVSDCEGRHTVRVPHGVDVTVKNDNGEVTASGFRTPLRISSDNGKVTVRDTTGPLDLRSDNGQVVTERVRAATVKVRTDNGSVRIGVREGAVPERVDVATDNGAIRVDLPRAGAPYAVDAHSENGKTDVDVARDGSSPRVVTARSDNGKVTVRGV